MTIGGTMSKGELLTIALRYDTAMSRAMLRALGIEPREPEAPAGTVVSVDRYRDMLWCFENHGSPMDRF